MCEDEHDRDGAESERSQGRTRVGRSTRALGDEAGDRKNKEELSELGRLEREEADVDPPRRATRGSADDEHNRDQSHRADEDRPPVAPVHVGIDEHADEQGERTNDGIDDLPLEVVMWIARDVVLRDAGDRPETDGDESGDAGHEQPVERTQQVAERQAVAAVPLEPCSL